MSSAIKTFAKQSSSFSGSAFFSGSANLNSLGHQPPTGMSPASSSPASLIPTNASAMSPSPSTVVLSSERFDPDASRLVGAAAVNSEDVSNAPLSSRDAGKQSRSPSSDFQITSSSPANSVFKRISSVRVDTRSDTERSSVYRKRRGKDDMSLAMRKISTRGSHGIKRSGSLPKLGGAESSTSSIQRLHATARFGGADEQASQLPATKPAAILIPQHSRAAHLRKSEDEGAGRRELWNGVHDQTIGSNGVDTILKLGFRFQLLLEAGFREDSADECEIVCKMTNRWKGKCCKCDTRYAEKELIRHVQPVAISTFRIIRNHLCGVSRLISCFGSLADDFLSWETSSDVKGRECEDQELLDESCRRLSQHAGNGRTRVIFSVDQIFERYFGVISLFQVRLRIHRAIGKQLMHSISLKLPRISRESERRRYDHNVRLVIKYFMTYFRVSLVQFLMSPSPSDLPIPNAMLRDRESNKFLTTILGPNFSQSDLQMSRPQILRRGDTFRFASIFTPFMSPSSFADALDNPDETFLNSCHRWDITFLLSMNRKLRKTAVGDVKSESCVAMQAAELVDGWEDANSTMSPSSTYSTLSCRVWLRTFQLPVIVSSVSIESVGRVAKPHPITLSFKNLSSIDFELRYEVMLHGSLGVPLQTSGESNLETSGASTRQVAWIMSGYKCKSLTLKKESEQSLTLPLIPLESGIQRIPGLKLSIRSKMMPEVPTTQDIVAALQQPPVTRGRAHTVGASHELLTDSVSANPREFGRLSVVLESMPSSTLSGEIALKDTGGRGDSKVTAPTVGIENSQRVESSVGLTTTFNNHASQIQNKGRRHSQTVSPCLPMIESVSPLLNLVASSHHKQNDNSLAMSFPRSSVPVHRALSRSITWQPNANSLEVSGSDEALGGTSKRGQKATELVRMVEVGEAGNEVDRFYQYRYLDQDEVTKKGSFGSGEMPLANQRVDLCVIQRAEHKEEFEENLVDAELPLPKPTPWFRMAECEMTLSQCSVLILPEVCRKLELIDVTQDSRDDAELEKYLIRESET